MRRIADRETEGQHRKAEIERKESAAAESSKPAASERRELLYTRAIAKGGLKLDFGATQNFVAYGNQVVALKATPKGKRVSFAVEPNPRNEREVMVRKVEQDVKTRSGEER